MSYTALGSFERGEDKQAFLERVELEPNFTYSHKSSLSQNPLDVFVFQDNIYNAAIYDLDVFIFVDKKLYTWGRIDDLKRHPNEEVRKVMKSISANIKEDM